MSTLIQKSEPDAKVAKRSKYHHGDLRRTVIDTALSTMREIGGWQFTLREIARRANVSHGAPYRHFPQKADLLRELALVGFDQLDEKLRGSLKDSKPAPELLRDLALAHLEFGEANPELYRLMFAADAVDPGELHTDPRTLAPFELVIGVLQRGQEQGSIKDGPPRGQATACWAHLHGLTKLFIDGRLLPTKVGENAIEESLDVLLAGLSVDAPPKITEG